MLPPPILSRSELRIVDRDLRPTTRVGRLSVPYTLQSAADAHRERADVANRDATLLTSRADDETGLAAEALRLAAQRRRRLAADELAAAQELDGLADRLAREGR